MVRTREEIKAADSRGSTFGFDSLPALLIWLRFVDSAAELASIRSQVRRSGQEWRDTFTPGRSEKASRQATDPARDRKSYQK